MARSAKRNTFGGIFFVDALASSVGIILLILFVFMSIGLKQNSPEVLSKIMKDNIESGNFPIETGRLVVDKRNRRITNECFNYPGYRNRQCALVRVFNDHIRLEWTGERIYKEEFESKKYLISAYANRFHAPAEDMDGLYFLIEENGMYHFLNNFNNEELQVYWNKEWKIDKGMPGGLMWLDSIDLAKLGIEALDTLDKTNVPLAVNPLLDSLQLNQQLQYLKVRINEPRHVNPNGSVLVPPAAAADQMEIVFDPALDSLLKKYDDLWIIIKEMTEELAGQADKNNNDKTKGNSWPGLDLPMSVTLELAQQGLLDTLAHLNNTKTEEEVREIMNEKIKEFARKHAIMSTAARKRKFTKEEFEERVKAYLEQQQNTFSSSSANIIFPDMDVENFFNPITKELLPIPFDPSIDRKISYLFPLNTPLFQIGIKEVDSLMIFNVDTSKTLIMDFHTRPLPYAETISMFARMGCTFQIDSVRYQEMEIPMFTYTWIPVKFISAGREEVFNRPVYLYGMNWGNMLQLPQEENKILFTDFALDTKQIEAPDFFWPRLLVGLALVLVFLVLLFIRKWL